jgi:hypothetical protein
VSGFKVFLAMSLFLIAGCGSENGAPTPRVEPVTEPPAQTWPLTYKGEERGRPCSITFHREYQLDGKAGVENYRLEVSTSYQHDGDGFGRVTLAFVGADGKTLQFTDASTDEFLRLGIKEPATTAANPTSFRVRWLHGDHHHDNTCINLQLAAP